MDSVVDVAKYLLKTSAVLSIPLFVTEQAPHLFGETVPEVGVAAMAASAPHLLHRFTKSKFSMLTPEVSSALKARSGVRQCVLFGIEAHVCVLQTALDLRCAGYGVHVVVDGTSSQRGFDRTFAFRRMEQSGVFLTTSESCLMQLMGDAAAPHFKAVAALLKEQNKTRPDPQL
jgi:hypothetical protein